MRSGISATSQKFGSGGSEYSFLFCFCFRTKACTHTQLLASVVTGVREKVSGHRRK